MKNTLIGLLFIFLISFFNISCQKENNQLTDMDKATAVSPKNVNLPKTIGARSGPYRIVSVASGKVIEAERTNNNGGRIYQWDYQGPSADQQLWHFTYLGSGYYQILNAYSGKALDLDANTAYNDGGYVQIWSWNGADNQQWQLSGNVIVNRRSEKVLDLEANALYTNGTIIQIWTRLDGDNQKWRLELP